MLETEVGELRRVIWRAVEFAWVLAQPNVPHRLKHLAWAKATAREWLVRFGSGAEVGADRKVELRIWGWETILATGRCPMVRPSRFHFSFQN